MSVGVDHDTMAVTRPARIPPRPGTVAPNLADYEEACRTFDWTKERRALASLPEGGLNIAHVAVDRHVLAGHGGRTAIRWLRRDAPDRVCTYRELALEASRFANVLDALGVRAGDRVFSLAGRVPDLYIAALGTLKHRAVFCPLFSAFGPEPIETRMAKGPAHVLITTAQLYEKKVAPIRDRLPHLEHVLVTDEVAPPGTHALPALMQRASPNYRIGPTTPDTPALLHFTSGTTGTPKGALHVHDAVVVHHATGRDALDLRPGDVYWCTADPGWVTGTSYGIVAPLACGVTMIVDEEEFDPLRWYRILQDRGVTVWYTAPTAIRMLMKAGTELAREHDLSSLRFVGSVGEPLAPEAVWWGLKAFDLPIHDNWWQTETGGIMIANYVALDIKPGSMGRPLPGIEVGILRDGRVVDDDTDGELAIRPGWPGMFRAYVGEPARYAKCFADDWYLTGDLARRDRDGYYWFVGRADDVIKSAGHLIGPFEVESALLEHPAVVEAAVIGKPDPIAGAVVKAFVALHDGAARDDALRRELMAFARRRLGSVVAPRELVFVDHLPKTRSGKIMRRLLLARELGMPEGDVSTLEGFP